MLVKIVVGSYQQLRTGEVGVTQAIGNDEGLVNSDGATTRRC